MDGNGNKRSLEELREHLEATPQGTALPFPASETIEVSEYPEDQDDDAADKTSIDIEDLVQAARQRAEAHVSESDSASPVGYVSNARNATSHSDVFQFWAPAEVTYLGIGSLVRHEAKDLAANRIVSTYGIVTKADAHTLGLDDFAVHVYEEDAQPPLESIIPAPSRRRPVVSYEAKVLSSNQRLQRPILSGPVYEVKASEFAELHGEEGEAANADDWPGANRFLLGFYEDGDGKFGTFAEERARVLGPKQGHVIFSGLPGAGKTSLFLADIIALYAQLRKLEGLKSGEEGKDSKWTR